MPGEVASIKYCLREPFEIAVDSVYRTLENRGLRVVGHLNVSRRVEKALGIALPPCRILFILPNPTRQSTPGVPPWAAIFLPLHVVISGNGSATHIEVQNRVNPGVEADGLALAAPVLETQARISEAIEAIAMRPSLVV